MTTGAAPRSPLAGVRILVPRPPHQASALSGRIRAAAGVPVEAATIRTVPGDADALGAAVGELRTGGFVGVCLTSANGVAALAEACRAERVAPRETLGGVAWVGAVGPRTAAAVAEHLGVAADVVPTEATGAALGAALPVGAGRVLLPRGDLARPELEHAVTASGHTPVPVVAYRTVTAEALPDEVAEALTTGAIRLVAATAASTVRGLVALLGDRALRARVVSIGPVTTAACSELGLQVAGEADPHDLDGLLAALTRVVAGGAR